MTKKATKKAAMTATTTAMTAMTTQPAQPPPAGGPPPPVTVDGRIRPVRPADVPRTVALIHRLAAYEKLPDRCHITDSQLHAALFAPRPAAFALAAFETAAADAEQVGYALYFLNFSTWEGVHGIYLEDLFVDPEHRGTGLGKALLASLAATARDRGYARVEWSVLDWNTPSIDFYRVLGAVPMDGWTTFRLAGPALARVGATDRT